MYCNGNLGALVGTAGWSVVSLGRLQGGHSLTFVIASYGWMIRCQRVGEKVSCAMS